MPLIIFYPIWKYYWILPPGFLWENALNLAKYLGVQINHKCRLVQWINSKIQRINSEVSIILCVKFLMRTLLFLCNFLKRFFKASFYHNNIIAHCQRSSNPEQRKNNCKNETFFKISILYMLVLIVLYDFIKSMEKKFLKAMNTMELLDTLNIILYHKTETVL